MRGRISIEEICDDDIDLDQNTRTDPDLQTSADDMAMYERYLNTVEGLRPLNQPMAPLP